MHNVLQLPVHEAAPLLLGRHLSANGVTIRIVEVEAYSGLGEDPASHAHNGKTARNAPMFGPAGTLYVYFTYGMHHCCNIVCRAEGEPSGVLLRAGEIVDGLDVARSRTPTSLKDHQLASGPARLARALNLDRAASGTSVLGGGPAYLLDAVDGETDALPVLDKDTSAHDGVIFSGPRIGIRKATELPWRFWLSHSPAVSGPVAARAGR